MGSAGAAIVFGLCAAISWGAGDFIGGFASRRIRPYLVIFLSQLAGLAMLIVIAAATGEPFPGPRDLLIGAAAGVAGVLGLGALYSGMALHKMGAIAPLSALLTALLPIIAGLIQDGLPTITQFAGLVVAAPAIYLVSREDESTGPLLHLSWPILKYPLFAGLGFGLFFILIDQVTEGFVYWPIVASRSASIPASALLGLIAARSAGAGDANRSGTPLARWLPAILVGGLFDAGGNIFFVLAAQAGRLDIASVLASLYPAGTVFLARVVVKERLSRTQRLGVFGAMIAVALFSL